VTTTDSLPVTTTDILPVTTTDSLPVTTTDSLPVTTTDSKSETTEDIDDVIPPKPILRRSDYLLNNDISDSESDHVEEAPVPQNKSNVKTFSSTTETDVTSSLVDSSNYVSTCTTTSSSSYQPCDTETKEKKQQLPDNEKTVSTSKTEEKTIIPVLQINNLLAMRLLHYIKSTSSLSGLTKFDSEFAVNISKALADYLSKVPVTE
jgi:hypothetical protein